MALKILLNDTNLLDNKSEAIVYFVEQDFDFSKNFKEIEKKYVPNLENLMKDRKFKGGMNSVFIVPSVKDFSYFIFLGLGKKKNKIISFENYRRALGKLVKILPNYSIKSLSMNLPEVSLFDVDLKYLTYQTATILKMSEYIFDDFITESERITEFNSTISISVAKNQLRILQSEVEKGLIIADAVNSARHWVDLPSNKLHPSDLAAHAEQIALDYKLKCKVFNEDQINKMGMGGLAAVSSGSEKDCRFVILEYQTKEKDAPTICFVGKGITFDSGGLSIKPAQHMETMKEDMSGAAAVIATMKALAQLKPKVNIVTIAPITENMPSGTAVKPGDIVKFYNGKTAEIKNTDAEGRLILADALSYAVKHFKPDAIIDLATLTGACAYALGPFFSGLFSQHEDIVKRVTKAAEISGDYVWRLPLTDDYKPAVKCEVADLCNIGKKQYQAGATTAACFLQHFVGNVPWAHLDIAGTAFNVPDISYYNPYSATGVGVRLLIELAMEWE